MKDWFRNFVAGVRTTLEVAPTSDRHQFGRGFLDHSIEDDLRGDVARVAAALTTALDSARIKSGNRTLPPAGR